MRHAAKIDIHHLPDKLLLEVFEFVLPDIEENTTTYMKTMKSLQRVSPHWKAVISSSATLWYPLIINPSSRVAVVEKQLARSGNRRLHLQLDLRNCQHSDNEFRQILDQLVFVDKRWNVLDMHGSHHYVYLALSAFNCTEVFPSLKRVHITGTGISFYPHFLLPDRVPVLEHLELIGFDGLSGLKCSRTVKKFKFSLATSKDNMSKRSTKRA